MPASGGILLTGHGPETTELAIGKFISDGRRDPSFGTNGTTQLPIPMPESSWVTNDRLAVQPDGRILVGMQRNQERRPHQWILVRVQSDGALDSSFNGDGTVEVTLPDDVGFASLAGVLVRKDGRILQVGSGPGFYLFAAQHLPNGQVDRSFGVEGKVQAGLPGGGPALVAAALDPRGNIVTIGTTGRPDSGRDLLIARFRQDMTPDTSFGFRGTTIVDVGRGADVGHAMKLLPDGRILVAGRATQGLGSSQPVLVRLTVDGDLDTTFGDGGIMRINTGKGPGNHFVSGVDLLSDGRIVFAGHYVVSDLDPGHPFAKVPQPFVVMLRADGTPDRSFGGDDGVVFFFGEGLLSEYVHVGVRPGDKLLVFDGAAAIQLLAAVPRIPTLRITIGASPNPAGPGPVDFHVDITNHGASSDGGIVRLRASKKVAVVGSTSLRATVDPNMIDVVGKVPAIAPGSTASLVLRTTVTGFEEGISLAGSVESTHSDGKPITSNSSIVVSTDRFATS